MIGIYKITNPKGKIYIGCTVNYIRRKKEYTKLYNSKGQTKLYNLFMKYGIENHIFDIIEECSEEILSEREIYWILYLNSIENGLNIRLGNRNGYLTSETKNNISKALKGRKNTWAKKGGGSKGYKYTEEQKEKMRKPRINKWKREKLVSLDIIEEIRNKFNLGYKRSYLSKEYKVSWGTIKNITDKINSYKDI